MCLAVPGRVIEVVERAGALRTGRVSFDGVVVEVCLEAVPDAGVGDFVIAHAGLAIARLDAAAAERTLAALRELP